MCRNVWRELNVQKYAEGANMCRNVWREVNVQKCVEGGKCQEMCGGS